MNRVLAAARLHVINPLVILGVPWLIVAIAFAMNMAIWALTDAREQSQGGITGGALALYITTAVVFVQAVTQLLPLAMGLSLSRRAFYLGTALVAVVGSLAYGVALSTLVAIEDATGGWGVGLNFWAPGPLDVDNWALQVLVLGAPMLAFTAAGIGIGVVYKRWGATGIWVLTVGTLLLTGGLTLLLLWQRGWDDVGQWLADQTVITLSVGLPLALAVMIGALAYAGIRRVVP